MRDEDGLLQAGEMVDEEYGLKAVDDGENRPALLLLDHGHILAARGAGVNFPAGQCYLKLKTGHLGYSDPAGQLER